MSIIRIFNFASFMNLESNTVVDKKMYSGNKDSSFTQLEIRKIIILQF